MPNLPSLHWLPAAPDWRSQLKAAMVEPNWDALVALANFRLDFVQTNALDRVLTQHFPEPPPQQSGKPIRLAVLSSSTITHLLPALRIAGLRRGLHVEIYEGGYGQYFQELLMPSGALGAFKPTALLLSLDARHLTLGLSADASKEDAEHFLRETQNRLSECWRQARERFGCAVLQQTVLPVLDPILGSNEYRLPGSPARMVGKINEWLRDAATEQGVDLVAVDAFAAEDGIAGWHSGALWHRSKQEVLPTAAPVYGDLVGRVLAAKQGRTAKCLILDLDNTIWGGVIGDDGIAGIVLGEGSPLGEAHLAIQRYALALARRGVILAVCSKNDEANAREPFISHTEMALRAEHIACFVANWNDKASNIRHIAETLNIGVDSLVFLDDNPFERALVRQELPMVGVPEVGDDPATYVRALSAGGYFEGLSVTADDLVRTEQYRANSARDELKASATDITGYLTQLDMRLDVGHFDAINLPRIVQLINKTNQFNLTTRRYIESEVADIIKDDNAFGLHLRLRDRFGDNGLIAVIIGRKEDTDVRIDTWLMSCRVLGRQVEATTLNVIADKAKKLGAARLIGEYIPTKKNDMVREHYKNLGFVELGQDGETAKFALDLATFQAADTFILVEAKT